MHRNLVITAFFTLPFLQLGISFYLSFQIFAIGLILILSGSQNVSKNSLFFIMVGLSSFILKILFSITNISASELLLIAREGFCFILLMLGINKIRKFENLRQIKNLCSLFLLASFIIITLQHLAISNGQFVSFPFAWFIMNESTLSGVGDALYHSARLRPVGFYAEPSYMALILTSVIVILISSKPNEKMRSLFFFTASVFMYLTLSSFAGILAILMILAVSTYTTTRNDSKKRKSSFIFLSIIFILSLPVVYLNPEYSQRLTGVFTGQVDPSTYIRYVIPFQMVADMFSNGFLFGYSNSEILYLADSKKIGSIDNAFFNLILHYGLLGILPIIALLFYVRSPILITYLLLALNFNGSYFAYDKVVIISLTVGLSLAAEKINNRVIHE